MIKTILSFLFPLIISSPVLAQSAPGGVSEDLNYWLKADAGVSLSQNRVNQWTNQSSSSGNISQNNTLRQPSFTPNALNFNPGITFNTTNNDFDFLSTDEFVWDSDTVFLVFNPSQSLGSNNTLQAVLVYNIPNNTFGDAGIGIGSITDSNDNFFNSTDITPAQSGEYIATARVSPNTTSDSVLAVVRQDTVTNPTRSELRFWGNDSSTNIINLSQFAGHQDTQFTIGQRDGGGLPFDGDVLEAISYSSRLNNASVRRVESYLSIKYGLTLNQTIPQDYISSSGNTTYDASNTLSPFVSNIAGIGRDDNSGLNQKQSRSTTTNSVQANNSGLITIGLGTIATTNALNTNNFPNDESFLIWGNNSASLNFNTPLTISSIPLSRMQRIWAIQETGNIGSVRIQIPQSVFNNNLVPSIIISSNTIFGNNDRVVTLVDDGNNNYIANINFTGIDFFTFAQSQQALDAPSPSIYVTPLPNGRTVIFEL